MDSRWSYPVPICISKIGRRGYFGLHDRLLYFILAVLKQKSHAITSIGVTIRFGLFCFFELLRSAG